MVKLQRRHLFGVLAVLLPLALFVAVKRAAKQRPQVLPAPAAGQAMVISPDGRFVVQGGGSMTGQITVFDRQANATQSQPLPIGSPQDTGSQTLLALPDSRLVAATHVTGPIGAASSIVVHDLVAPGNSRVIARGRVIGPALAFIPATQELTSFNGKGELCFWHLTTGRLQRKWPRLISRTPPKLNSAPNSQSYSVPLALALSPDGKTLAVAGIYQFTRSGGMSGFQKLNSPPTLWNAQTRRKIRVFSMPSDAQLTQNGSYRSVLCTSLMFSPDGRWLSTDSNGDVVIVWDVQTGAVSHVLHHPQNQQGNTIRHQFNGAGVAFSPKGDWIAAPGNYGTVDIWNLADGRLHKQLDASGPTTFLPDGSQLISSGSGPNKNLLAWPLSWTTHQ